MSKQLCKRPRCRRWKNLSEYGYCGGHQCPVPGCPEGKSNTISVRSLILVVKACSLTCACFLQMCELHVEQARLKLPKYWSRAFVSLFYVTMTDSVAA